MPGDILQRKIDKPFNGLPILFGITDAILIAVFDEPGRDYIETVKKALKYVEMPTWNSTKTSAISDVPVFSSLGK